MQARIALRRQREETAQEGDEPMTQREAFIAEKLKPAVRIAKPKTQQRYEALFDDVTELMRSCSDMMTLTKSLAEIKGPPPTAWDVTPGKLAEQIPAAFQPVFRDALYNFDTAVDRLGALFETLMMSKGALETLDANRAKAADKGNLLTLNTDRVVGRLLSLASGTRPDLEAKTKMPRPVIDLLDSWRDRPLEPVKQMDLPPAVRTCDAFVGYPFESFEQ